jgi:hypothetical protein
MAIANGESQIANRKEKANRGFTRMNADLRGTCLSELSFLIRVDPR